MKWKTYIWIGLMLIVRYGNSQAVTYHQNIKPIIDRHCITCHSQGDIGAFDFSSYDRVAASARMIEYVTAEKLMPPWKAKSIHPLKFSNTLSPLEIEEIKTWVSTGLPEGKIEVINQNEDSAHDLKLDSNSIIFSMKKPSGPLTDYKIWSRVFVIPYQGEEDLYIDALEFIPGKKELVLSCAISIDTSRIAENYSNDDTYYGYTSEGGVAFEPFENLWHYWTPDQGVSFLDSGYVKRIPAGSNLLFHITYAPIRSPKLDSSYLIVRKTTSDNTSKLVESKNLINVKLLDFPFEIEPNEVRRFKSIYQVKADMEILGITPVGQYICRSWEVYVVDKSGVKKGLIEIDDWEYMWKRKYEFQSPITVTKGSEIHAIATYDNTLENMFNPLLQPKKIIHGETRSREPYIVQFDYVSLKEDVNVLREKRKDSMNNIKGKFYPNKPTK